MPSIRKRNPATGYRVLVCDMRERKIKARVGFTCGTFDFVHAGHHLMLKEAKSLCRYLIVGLLTDPTRDRPHKNRPVQSVRERKIQLEGCRYVDEVILYHSEKELLRLLKDISPDIRILGGDWKRKQFTGRDLPIRTHFNSRQHNHSSSELRRRVAAAERGRSSRRTTA